MSDKRRRIEAGVIAEYIEAAQTFTHPASIELPKLHAAGIAASRDYQHVYPRRRDHPDVYSRLEDFPGKPSRGEFYLIVESSLLVPLAGGLAAMVYHATFSSVFLPVFGLLSGYADGRHNANIESSLFAAGLTAVFAVLLSWIAALPIASALIVGAITAGLYGIGNAWGRFQRRQRAKKEAKQ